MPKQVLQVTNFSGGLNNYKDARDLDNNEFSQNWNAMVDTEGVIKVAGMASDSIYTDSFTNENFQKGYGLFLFSVDYGLFSIDADFNSGIATGTLASVTSTSVFVLESKPSTSSTVMFLLPIITSIDEPLGGAVLNVRVVPLTE